MFSCCCGLCLLHAGKVRHEFVPFGNGPGAVLANGAGLRFNADGSRLIIAEGDQTRLKVFGVDGTYHGPLGEGVYGVVVLSLSIPFSLKFLACVFWLRCSRLHAQLPTF